MIEESKKRHIAKTLTWRVTATFTTMIIAWVVSGDPMTGLTVGGIEFFIKMPVYYFLALITLVKLHYYVF